MTDLPLQIAETRSRSVSKQAHLPRPRFRMSPRGVRLLSGEATPETRASNTEEKKGKVGSTHGAQAAAFFALGSLFPFVDFMLFDSAAMTGGAKRGNTEQIKAAKYAASLGLGFIGRGTFMGGGLIQYLRRSESLVNL